MPMNVEKRVAPRFRIATFCRKNAPMVGPSASAATDSPNEGSASGSVASLPSVAPAACWAAAMVPNTTAPEATITNVRSTSRVWANRCARAAYSENARTATNSRE